MSKKNNPIFDLKMAIERDGDLSHAARTLGFRICSYVASHAQFHILPYAPFPLPWTQCRTLLWNKMKEDQIYRLISQLVGRGYLALGDKFGCPPTRHYRLILDPSNSRKNAGIESSTEAGIESSKKAGTVTGINAGINSLKKACPLNNNSASQEGIKTKGSNGSLCSKVTKGNKLAASPSEPMTDAQRKSAAETLRKLKNEIKSS